MNEGAGGRTVKAVALRRRGERLAAALSGQPRCCSSHWAVLAMLQAPWHRLLLRPLMIALPGPLLSLCRLPARHRALP